MASALWLCLRLDSLGPECSPVCANPGNRLLCLRRLARFVAATPPV